MPTLLSGLRRRHRQPEVMDQPDLDPALHEQALTGLERINFWSRSGALVWPDIAALAGHVAPRPLRILDLACGAGDVAVHLWRRARRADLPITVDGCDISPRAIAHAERRARDAGAAVTFFPLDVLAEPLPDGYDVLISSLFLHHLDDEVAVELLRNMAAAARAMVLIHDLERGAMAYALAWFACHVLTRSPVVHADGPLSVEAAFTVAEARRLAERAGLAGATVRRRWPFRYLLRWTRT